MVGVCNFERVKSERKCCVGRVEVDDVLQTAPLYKAHVVYGKVAVGINDGVALIVKDVTQRKQLERTGLPCSSLSDDVDVAATVIAKHAELVIDTAEIGQAKSRNILIDRHITSDNR